ncbi:Glycosyltransferase family 69 protein [Mycena venus]|uniref:Glycosyltransferase family 69 protein n=1 Tax=Mycena venus TaxID=2733690 RepID=A0A8H6WUV2_9AGAR|nr:Glycosyltransferase family 69 protein [Mycena venus]
MPSPAPFSSPQNNLAFPALYLDPLNDSFIPKHIPLSPPGRRVKIGRRMNSQTSPEKSNGYFDSKSMSREHAEVWEENGKIFIKDVKSTNGTFVNGERLSPQSLESEPLELKTNDNVEFGIGIVDKNKKAILHEVAARVSCILPEQQARADQQQNQGQYSQSSMLPPSRSPGRFGLNGMGGMGASMRAPGKSGLTFDHILSRLQGELTKSRETGQDLQTLSGAMNDIQDTLGGSLVCTVPISHLSPHVLPPVRPPQAESSAPSPPQLHLPAPETGSPALSELQSQLLTTQSSLASHVDKIRALEGVLAEQEAIKQEVRTLRDLVGVLQQGSAAQEPKGGFDLEDDEGEADDEDSDAHSVSTVMPHALERVDEEDEEEEDEPVHADDKQDEEHEPRSLSPEHQDIFQEHEEDREQRRAELGRPRTPEPTNMGMSRNLARSSTLRSPLAASSSSDASVASPPGPTINELTNRLALLSTQLESALAMSSTLQAQHAAAQSTIVALEDKVKRLEGLVSAVVSSAPSNKETTDSKKDTTESPAAAESAVTAALLSFKNSLQGQWSSVQEEWAQERERLKRTRDDWENQMRGMVDERIKAKFTNSFPAPMSYPHANGGLATPPSPRSLSADSAHGRRRRRRSTSRGRSGSPKGVNGNGDILNGSDSAPGEPHSSVHASSLSSFDGKALLSSAAASDIAPTSPPAEAEKSLRALNGSGQHKNQNDNTAMHIQTAIGVLVLSVAAAAVIWRVKPE